MSPVLAGLTLLAAAPSDAMAQSTAARGTHAAASRSEAPTSAGRALTGALLGGAAGALVGGLAGGTIGGNWCVDAGQPDSCRGLAGVVTGGVAGITLGVPVGAHLLNRRRGKLAPSLLASTALAIGGVVAFRQADAHARGGSRTAILNGIVISVPLLQIVSATIIETRTSR